MIEQQQYRRFASDPLEFIESLQIDVSGTIRRFAAVMADFQRDDFTALAPGMLRCAGRKDDPTARMRFWGERPRGASKSTDIAAVCVWLLVFAKNHPLRLSAWAADREQAGILRSAVQTLIRLNPWLGSILSVERDRVVNIADGHPGETGSLSIESSDAASSYGALVDAVIADEICHWEERAGQELFTSITSTMAKRTNTLFFGITNSGFVDSWQWKVREVIRNDPAWIFSRMEGKATWVSEATLAEQRRLLPPAAFSRLWENCWSNLSGDVISEADLLAAVKDHLREIPAKLDGYEFVAGVDLSVSRDASAICVLGVRKRRSWEADAADHGRSRLAYCKVWKPERGDKVNLQQIEDTLLALNSKYAFHVVNYDPFQAVHLAQRLSLQRLTLKDIPFTGQNLQKMATALIEVFNDKRIDLYPEPALLHDLRRARIVERSYGFRLEFPRDATGHGDLGTAFCLANFAAVEIAGRPSIRSTAFSQGMDDDDGDSTNYAARFALRQRAFQREMDRLSKGGSNDRQERFVKTMLNLPDQ